MVSFKKDSHEIGGVLLYLIHANQDQHTLRDYPVLICFIDWKGKSSCCASEHFPSYDDAESHPLHYSDQGVKDL